MASRELLNAQAVFMGLNPEVYLRGSDALRADMLAKHEAKLRRNAKMSPHQSEEDYIERNMRDFPRTEEDLRLRKTKSSEIRETKKKRAEPVKPVKPPVKRKPKNVDELDEEDDEDVEFERREIREEDPGFSKPYDVQEGVRVYHDMGDEGDYPTHDKMQRDGLTVSPIIEVDKPVDLIGDRPPKTLTDLYSRWPIEEDAQYHLRLERTKPKTYQGVNTAGFVGDIRGRRISEVEIAQTFGGSEYKITLYGPDPRGRTDSDGRIKIKALTEQITLTVPVYPPIMTTIAENSESIRAMNPFGPMVAPPTTSGDASIHKANASFFADAMKLQKEDANKQAMMATQATSSLISVLSESSKTQLELMREEARKREESHKREMEKLQEDLKRAQQEKGTVASEVAKAKDDANVQFMKYVEKLAPDKQAEIARLSDYYNSQQENQRRSHEDQMKSLREMQQLAIDRLTESHKSTVERLESRNREIEQNYRLLLEQERSQASKLLEQERSQSSKQLELERSQWASREQQLRDQMREQSSNEREMAMKRIEDLKERHEAEIKNLERGHERELRSLRDSADVKMTVAKETSTMIIKHAEERLKDAQEEAERAREEAEEAKDLTKQLERAERQAELLGFEKKDAHEPKGAWERLAATAGAGISQLASNADQWLPAVLAKRAESQAMAAQQQQIRQMQGPQRVRPGEPNPAQQQQPRPGGVEWAKRGAQVRPRTAPVPAASVQGPPPGFKEEMVPSAPPVAPPVAVQSVDQQEPQGEDQAQQQGEQDSGLPQIEFPPKFQQFFPNEAMVGFLVQAEQSVRDHVDAAGFASLMVGMYSDGARTMVENFEPKEITDVVEQLGNTQSPLLRRDGRKWLDRLWKELRRELRAQAP